MAIKIGTVDLDQSKIYIGTQEIAEVYVGANKVWPDAPTGEYVATANTIGLWHLNGNANDSSGNGLHGTNIGNISYNTAYGKYNEGISGGYGQCISIPDNNLLDLTTFTISCWINVNSSYGNTIISKFKAASSSDVNYYIDYDGGGNRLRVFFSANGTFYNNTVNYALTTGVWHNIIMTAGSGNVTVYIDGDSRASISYTGTIATNTYPLVFCGRIAANGTSYESFFSGYIDEVFIENLKWTSQQVSEYYTARI